MARYTQELQGSLMGQQAGRQHRDACVGQRSAAVSRGFECRVRSNSVSNALSGANSAAETYSSDVYDRSLHALKRRRSIHTTNSCISAVVVANS